MSVELIDGNMCLCERLCVCVSVCMDAVSGWSICISEFINFLKNYDSAIVK